MSERKRREGASVACANVGREVCAAHVFGVVCMCWEGVVFVHVFVALKEGSVQGDSAARLMIRMVTALLTVTCINARQ